MADDFETGTRSAACGGTQRSFLSVPEQGQTLREAVAAYRKKAEGKCMTTFHFI